jgi:hypothetical protein
MEINSMADSNLVASLKARQDSYFQSPENNANALTASACVIMSEWSAIRTLLT